MKTIENGGISARMDDRRQAGRWSVGYVCHVEGPDATWRFSTRPLSMAGVEYVSVLQTPWAVGDRFPTVTLRWALALSSGATLSDLDRLWAARSRLTGRTVRLGMVFGPMDSVEADDIVWIQKGIIAAVAFTGETLEVAIESLRTALDREFPMRSITWTDWPGAAESCVGRSAPLVFGHVEKAPLLPVDVGWRSILLDDAPWNGSLLRTRDARRFPAAGVVILESEWIAYHTIDRDAGTLSGLTRGYAGTTPAFHRRGTIIQEHRDAYVFLAADHPCVAISNVQIGESEPPAGTVRSERRVVGGRIVETVVFDHLPQERVLSSHISTLILGAGELGGCEWMVGERDRLGMDDDGLAIALRVLDGDRPGRRAELAGDRNHLHLRMTSTLEGDRLGELVGGRVRITYASPGVPQGIRVLVSGAALSTVAVALSVTENGDDAGGYVTQSIDFSRALPAESWNAFSGDFNIDVGTSEWMEPGDEVQLLSLVVELDIRSAEYRDGMERVVADVSGWIDATTGAVMTNPGRVARHLVESVEGAWAGAGDFDSVSERFEGGVGPDGYWMPPYAVHRRIGERLSAGALLAELAEDCRLSLWSGNGVSGQTPPLIHFGDRFVLNARNVIDVKEGEWTGRKDLVNRMELLYRGRATDWARPALSWTRAVSREAVVSAGQDWGVRPANVTAPWLGGSDQDEGMVEDWLIHRLWTEGWPQWTLQLAVTPECVHLEPGDEVTVDVPCHPASPVHGRVSATGHVDGHRLLIDVALSNWQTPEWASGVATGVSALRDFGFVGLFVHGQLTGGLDDSGNVYAPRFETADLSAISGDGPLNEVNTGGTDWMTGIRVGLADTPVWLASLTGDGMRRVTVSRAVTIREGQPIAEAPGAQCVETRGDRLVVTVAGRAVGVFDAATGVLSLAGQLIEAL